MAHTCCASVQSKRPRQGDHSEFPNVPQWIRLQGVRPKGLGEVVEYI